MAGYRVTLEPGWLTHLPSCYYVAPAS